MVIIDGLPFGDQTRPMLQELKRLAGELGLPIWFTVTIHRHQDPANDGLPVQLSPVQDLFDTAIALQPDDQTIHIEAIKGAPGNSAETALTLDPATMLIQSRT
jgi:hypothetical protein